MVLEVIGGVVVGSVYGAGGGQGRCNAGGRGGFVERSWMGQVLTGGLGGAGPLHYWRGGRGGEGGGGDGTKGGDGGRRWWWLLTRAPSTRWRLRNPMHPMVGSHVSAPATTAHDRISGCTVQARGLRVRGRYSIIIHKYLGRYISSTPQTCVRSEKSNLNSEHDKSNILILYRVELEANIRVHFNSP